PRSTWHGSVRGPPRRADTSGCRSRSRDAARAPRPLPGHPADRNRVPTPNTDPSVSLDRGAGWSTLNIRSTLGIPHSRLGLKPDLAAPGQAGLLLRRFSRIARVRDWWCLAELSSWAPRLRGSGGARWR